MKSQIFAFAGSLRKDSYNKQLLLETVELAKQMQISMQYVWLNEFPMPFYDADLETNQGMPAQAKRFRDLLIEHSSILIVSPEYNASVPAVLKNAIDWASRNEEGKPSYEAFAEKRFGLMSASPGKLGGSRALKHLRESLNNLKAQVLESQVSIPQADQYFSQKQRPVNEQIRGLLSNLQ